MKGARSCGPLSAWRTLRADVTSIQPARFDDLTPGREHSFVLEDSVDEFVATEPTDVPGVLAAVERATASGHWAAGYLAYEAAPAFDEAFRVRSRDPQAAFADLPLAWFGVYRTRKQTDSPIPGDPYHIGPWEPTISAADHRAAVGRIRSRIAAGDTYQVNYTFRLTSPVRGDLDALYADLVRAQRGAYGAMLDIGGHVILSASPELFFRTEGSRITVRPMKGTIRRGRWSEEDRRLAHLLTSSEKDRAENLMIVDLLRNDLGRIARFGSVHVPELFTPERYETVWQLTSTIQAELIERVGVGEIMGALFPSGSITGAPKASTMGFIAEYETTPRGVYCGAIGYVAPGGDAHFSVAIRTVVVDRTSGVAEYGTGGGITWDSSASDEHTEALLKAQLLTTPADRFRLLETIRCDDGTFLYLDEHLDRLTASAGYYGFAFDEVIARKELESAAVPGTSHRLRLLVDRAGSVEVEVAEALDEPFADEYDPQAPAITIALTPDPVDADDAGLFHKTTRRDRYQAARDAVPWADDALLWNRDGMATETTVANIAIATGSGWATPPIESGCLPGVYRRVLVDGRRVTEQPLSVDDIEAAEHVAVFNSVRGWRRARLVDT